MACSIIRNPQTNEIERVLAPNGQDSLLYKSINESNPDKESSLRTWASVYTDTFKQSFGDWEGVNQKLKNDPSLDDITKETILLTLSGDLDINGEPLFETLPVEENNTSSIEENLISDINNSFNNIVAQSDNVSSTQASDKVNKFTKILDKLQGKFNIPWEIDNNQQSIGRFENGKVYINMNLVQDDTPFHEYAHPFVELIKLKNPVLYKSLSSRANKLVTLDGTNISEYVKNLYPDLKGDDLTSEIITTAIGLASQKQIQEDTDPSGPFARFMEIMRTFFNKLVDYFQELTLQPHQKIIASEINPETSFEDLARILFYTDNQIDFEGLTFEKLFEQRANDVFNRLKEIGSKVTLREEDHKYFVDGKEVKGSVHSDIVEPFLFKIYGDNSGSKTPEQLEAEEALIERGTDIHADFEEVGKRYVDSNTGLLREEPLEKDKVNTNDDIYGSIESYMQDLFKSYPKDTKFLFETRVYDSSVDRAGTIDFLAITPEGKLHIRDWKSIKTQIGNQKIEDNSGVKRKTWQLQIEEYARILKSLTGAEVESAMAIPIESNPVSIKDEGTGKYRTEKSKTIAIGNINPNLIDSEKERYLIPIAIESQRTKNPNFNGLIDALYSVLNQSFAMPKSTEAERSTRFKKINEISDILRDLQVRQSVESLIDRGNELLYGTANLLKEEINDDNIKLLQEYKQEATFLSSLNDRLFELIKSSTLSGTISEENREFQTKLAGVVARATFILNEIKVKEIEFATKMGEPHNIKNVNQAEVKIAAMDKWFVALSNFSQRTFRLFYVKLREGQNKRDRQTKEGFQDHEKLNAKLKKWAEDKGLTLTQAYDKLFRKDDQGNVNPTGLLGQYSKEYWAARKAAVDKKDIDWFKENHTFDEKAYKKAYADQLAFWKDFYTTRIEDVGRREKVIQREMMKFEQLYNVKDNPKAWFSVTSDYVRNQTIRIKEKHQSADWKFLHAKGNEPLLEFYTHLVAVNEKARKLGMIDHSNFVATVRADKLEQFLLNKGKGIANVFNFLDDLRADRVGEGFGEIDPQTGKVIQKIPNPYNYSLGVKKSDGTYDYSAQSKDLGQIGALWIAAVNQYEMQSELETTGQILYAIEKDKDQLVTDKYGKVIANKKVSGTGANSELLQGMINYYVYGHAEYAQNDIKLGDYSLVKGTRKLMAWMSNKTIGLNLYSAASNLFGGSANAFMELPRLKLGSEKEWMESGYQLASKNMRAWSLLNRIQPLLENQTMNQIHKASASRVKKFLSTENLYVFLRASDKAVQLPVAVTVMKNYMINNGKLEKISTVAARNINHNITGMTMEQVKEADKKLNAEIARLKEKNSIFNKTQIAENDEINDPEFTDEIADQLKNIIQRVNKRILGNSTSDDIMYGKTVTLGMLGLQFRSWMPELIRQRFGGSSVDLDLETFTYGKTRNFVKHIFTKDFVKLSKELLFGLGDVTLNRINDVYNEKKSQYVAKGFDEENFPTYSEFKDQYLGNIKSQMREFSLLIGIFALTLSVGSISPDDDDEKAKLAATLRLINKLNNELSFYYVPTNFTELVNKPIPAMGIVTGLVKLVENTTGEAVGALTGDEARLKRNHPQKYIYKLNPFSNQATQILSIFDSEFRKENDIKIK